MLKILSTLIIFSDYIAFYAALVLAYLFGSIPWALVIGKVFYKTDIRNYGSGNLGGTNAGRVLGKKAGVIVILLDALKAFFTVVLCRWYVPEASIYAGMLCCIGHCFPIFAHFKGGKAVATCFGYLIAISLFVTHHFFWMAIVPLISFFVLLYFSKMVSLSSIGSLGVATITAYFFSESLSVFASVALLWVFVVWRHRANIERIRKGEEKKITWM